MIRHLGCTCFGSTYTKIGTIQRRLAWPLRKDDTQIREAFHIFFSPHPSLLLPLLTYNTQHLLTAICFDSGMHSQRWDVVCSVKVTDFISPSSIGEENSLQPTCARA